MAPNSRLPVTVRAPWAVLVLFLSSAQSDLAVAQPQDNVTVDVLRKELAARDAVIVDLLDRVRALEAARAGTDGANGAAGGRHSDPTLIPAAPEPGPRPTGEFAIDESQAERALERGLVEEGARLLRPGQVELTPGFLLTHDKGMFPTALMVNDGSVVGEIEQTFDIYERTADLRIGLPLDAQLDVGVPYRVVDQETRTGIDGAIQSVEDQTGSGFGDISVGLAKVLATEDSWRPNLIGRLVWLSGSGDERDGAVFLGGGNSGIGTQLNAYWRRDPVVFLMSGGYTHFASDGMVRPGDSIDLSLGLGLAVSPETALIFSLDQSFIGEFERNGVTLAGTDRLSSTLGLSASTILGRKLFLRVNAGVGLTEDTPDYRFGVSLGSRFDAR
jgi:hypothetical protein